MLKKLGLVAAVLLAAVVALFGYTLARHYVYWSPAEEVTFSSGQTRLAGTFVKPAEEGVFPALLLLHGSGPEPRTEPPTRAVINTLVRSGIAALVYDKRGVGASGGDFESATYADFIDDAGAAVEYLASRPDVDPGRIGLYTVSESGWFGPEIAFRTQKVSLVFNKVAAPLPVAETVLWEARNDYVASGVDESEVQPLVDHAARRWAYYREAANNPELGEGPERDAIASELATLRTTVAGAAEALPEELPPYDAERYKEMAAELFYDPRPYLLALDVPLYYAYGAEDRNIPTRRSVEALEVLIGEHGKEIDYTVYPGLGHSLASWRGLFEMGWPPGYLENLAAWATAKWSQSERPPRVLPAAAEPIPIPGGTFLQGTPAARVPELRESYGVGFPGAFENETPARRVTLSPFRLDPYEVTNARFARFLEERPEWRPESLAAELHNGRYLEHWTASGPPAELAEHPVVFVNWHAAQAFCRWAGGRLPTEAEWEYAARAGGGDREFPWGDEPPHPRLANYHASAISGTSPVGAYPPTGLGLFDLAGNVWELLLDEWQESYEPGPVVDPVAGSAVTDDNLLSITGRRAVRGASYGGAVVNLRTRWRDSHVVTNAREFIGFRCAYPGAP